MLIPIVAISHSDFFLLRFYGGVSLYYDRFLQYIALLSVSQYIESLPLYHELNRQILANTQP